jgi:hypothetical protein
MAVNNKPVFAKSVVLGSAYTIATLTARTNITGVGGITKITNTITDGGKIEWIQVQLVATSALAVVFIWLYDGTTSSIILEVPIPAITPDTTTPAASALVNVAHLNLTSTHQLYASTTIAQNTNVHALGGGFS